MYWSFQVLIHHRLRFRRAMFLLVGMHWDLPLSITEKVQLGPGEALASDPTIWLQAWGGSVGYECRFLGGSVCFS